MRVLPVAASKWRCRRPLGRPMVRRNGRGGSRGVACCWLWTPGGRCSLRPVACRYVCVQWVATLLTTLPGECTAAGRQLLLVRLAASGSARARLGCVGRSSERVGRGVRSSPRVACRGCTKSKSYGREEARGRSRLREERSPRGLCVASPMQLSGARRPRPAALNPATARACGVVGRFQGGGRQTQHTTQPRGVEGSQPGGQAVSTPPRGRVPGCLLLLDPLPAGHTRQESGKRQAWPGSAPHSPTQSLNAA